LQAYDLQWDDYQGKALAWCGGMIGCALALGLMIILMGTWEDPDLAKVMQVCSYNSGCCHYACMRPLRNTSPHPFHLPLSFPAVGVLIVWQHAVQIYSHIGHETGMPLLNVFGHEEVSQGGDSAGQIWTPYGTSRPPADATEAFGADSDSRAAEESGQEVTFKFAGASANKL
jgi:hypothetical protein